MDAKLGQGFNPRKILELIRLWLQPVFVWEDRWVLRSLPLAAMAGITGQALMGSGIASCCISNNEQWQALHSHNKSQATLETLKTRLGACFSSAFVSVDEQTDSVASSSLSLSLIHICCTVIAHSRPPSGIHVLWLACTAVPQEYWTLTDCFIGTVTF